MLCINKNNCCVLILLTTHNLQSQEEGLHLPVEECTEVLNSAVSIDDALFGYI